MNVIKANKLTRFDPSANQPEPTKPDDKPSGTSTQVYHTVVRGDTLYKIAAKYNTTLNNILKLNPDIKNPSLIKPGQKIRVK